MLTTFIGDAECSISKDTHSSSKHDKGTCLYKSKRHDGSRLSDLIGEYCVVGRRVWILWDPSCVRSRQGDRQRVVDVWHEGIYILTKCLWCCWCRVHRTSNKNNSVSTWKHTYQKQKTFTPMGGVRDMVVQEARFNRTPRLLKNKSTPGLLVRLYRRFVPRQWTRHNQYPLRYGSFVFA